MAHKTLTLDRESLAPPTAVKVKTGADALAFYRRKTAWLSPRKIAGIERQLSEKRRSPRS
jgi:hypothetical protein